MGVIKLFSDDNKKYKRVETPDPVSFKVLEIYVQSFRVKDKKPVALKIKYDGCSNYNGIKILVYESKEAFEILSKRGSVDPHFLENEYSPIARFEPTERGWMLACKLVDDLV